MNCLLRLSLSFVLLFLLGCQPGPKYKRPETPIDNQMGFINADSSEEKTQGMSHWWTRIGDELLNNYIEELLSNNYSLKEAAERVAQAREQLNIEGGGALPSLGLASEASRSFGPSELGRVYSNRYEPKATASWEIDLFGKIRKTIEAADASYLASEFDKESLEQTLISDLVRRRVAVAVNSHLLQLAKENSKNQHEIYTIVKRRYDLGSQSTNLSDVYVAEENYKSIQADIHVFERQLTEEMYRLDILLGRLPGYTKANTQTFPVLPPPRDVALSVPAKLLDRRPDLRASELRLVAANAEIGVAIADLYPGVNLGASIGFVSDSTGNLFSAQQLAGSLVNSITTRIFEGGALRANIRLKESQARELSASYVGNVLEAIREVETALKAEQELEKELENKEQSVRALKLAEKITEERYRKGIETLRDFLEIQQRRYAVEQDWLITQLEKWNARIDLYLALGGDWVEELSQED